MICDELAGGDDTVGLERGLELGQRLQARVGPDPLVGLELLLAPVDFDRDRDDLAVEASLVRGAGGALMTADAEAVEILTAEVPLLRDQLGRDALGHQTADGLVTLHHLRTERESRAVAQGGAHRHAGHGLDARGDDDVVRAGDHTLGGKVRRLL